ncbi:MAG: ATP-dependent DNA helicase [Deltaproteobacteria bacterium]|nr:ATP-dependent DNA helicase [Deltaproteobacteria bacterium]
MKKKITVSVRNLVEYSCRSGDLYFEGFSQINPREAIFAHQKVQRSRPKEYTGEVTVSREFETENHILEVKGRMDGIFRYPDSVIIEEIKTTTRDLEYYDKNVNPVHWAQLKVYCYICALQEEYYKISAQLTYYQLETGRMKEIRETYDRTELETFFYELSSHYLKRIDNLEKWWSVRNNTIKMLEFPFSNYRPGQREMAVEVYSAILKERELLVQAATGIGKTMSTLFPSIKAMAEGLSSKVFYLTARTTGKDSAESAINEMREKGLRIKSLTITAKDKICFRPDSACTPDECEYARGYFDRIDMAEEEFFNEDALSREAIERIARKHMVCPFEFSLGLSLMADVIICDYNYVFDPRVYLRRFFLEEENDFILLVDEAHNLVDRSREMFSAEINKRSFLDTRKALKEDLPDIYKKISSINSGLLRCVKKFEEGDDDIIVEQDAPVDILPSLRHFLKAAEEWFSLNIPASFKDALLEIYFSVRTFARILEEYDETYRTIYETAGKDLRLKLYCIDPSARLGRIFDKNRTAIFFSATMSPPHYFKRLFGCSEGTRNIEIPSPFPPENLCLIIYSGVSTLYKNREATKVSAAALINPVIDSKKGNYLLFFPSYAYMKMVTDLFEPEKTDFEIIIQNPGMTREERDNFLGRFSTGNDNTLVGFAVMGGIFGEGIDLTGDRLSGAVIYGVGLPGISPERDIIRDYFNETDNAGYEYAYLYPGINRVLQAAGRVIRSERDRGVVVLVDDRYKSYRYKSLFPVTWKSVSVNSKAGLDQVLEEFWAGKSG